MPWSYDRLWIMLIKKNLKKTDLLKIAGINSSALTKMGKKLPVTMDTLEKLCRAFECRIEDIVEYVPNDNDINMRKE